MRKKLKKIGAFSLALLFAVPTVFYGGNVSTKAEAEAPCYEDGTELFEKQFYLGAWCEPALSDEEFDKYKDCGFNVMYLNNKVKYNQRNLFEYLKKANDKDLKVVLALGINRAGPISVKLQETPLDTYPAFYGICSIDEPLGDGSANPRYSVKQNAATGVDKDYPTIYDYIYSEYEYFKETYPGKMFTSVVANGNNPGDFANGSLPAYKQMVLEKIADPKDRALEMDRYPYYVDRDGEFKMDSGYLRFLYNFAETGKTLNIGKRTMYYQQLWYYDMRDYISAQEITYQLYSAMCFGMNGFVAYHYASYWQDYKNQERFIMNSAWGERELCYYNKVALEEIKKFDHIYLDFADNWQGVMKVKGTEFSNDAEEMFNNLTSDKVYDGGNYILNSYDRLSNATSTQDAIIGVMKDSNGRDGFMISNQTFTLNRKSTTVSLTFKNATKALVVEKGETKTVDLDNGKYTVTIAPGSGAFVIPY